MDSPYSRNNQNNNHNNGGNNNYYDDNYNYQNQAGGVQQLTLVDGEAYPTAYAEIASGAEEKYGGGGSGAGAKGYY